MGEWTWGNLGLTRVRSLAIDFTNPNNLYAGTDSGPGIGGPVLFKWIEFVKTAGVFADVLLVLCPHFFRDRGNLII